MRDLKPCPMCGSNFMRLSDFEEYVACDDCGTLGPSGKNEAEAIAAWNRRATPPEVTALVEAATDMADCIRDFLANYRLDNSYAMADALTKWEEAQK